MEKQGDCSPCWRQFHESVRESGWEAAKRAFVPTASSWESVPLSTLEVCGMFRSYSWAAPGPDSDADVSLASKVFKVHFFSAEYSYWDKNPFQVLWDRWKKSLIPGFYLVGLICGLILSTHNLYEFQSRITTITKHSPVFLGFKMSPLCSIAEYNLRSRWQE